MTTIPNVNVCMQREEKIYSFSLPAETIISLCRVERFGVDPEGVNRKLNEPHAIEIAEAYLDKSLLWMEPILGDLSGGGWVYDPVARELRFNGGSYISIDDGQHRWHALTLLNQIEREHLAFNLTVTMGLPFEKRLKVFRMQQRRKKIDARLDFAQRHRISDWKNPIDREAYEIVLALNSDTTSPLRGMILLDEQEKRPHESRHRPSGVNANGLQSTIKSVIGPKSPLHALSPEQRSKVIMTLIRLIASTWPTEWKSDKHKLTTALGINSILRLMVSSPNFRGAIADNFSQESLQRGLRLLKSFKWTSGNLRNVGQKQLVDKLDQHIIRNNKSVAA